MTRPAAAAAALLPTIPQSRTIDDSSRLLLHLHNTRHMHHVRRRRSSAILPSICCYLSLASSASASSSTAAAARRAAWSTSSCVGHRRLGGALLRGVTPPPKRPPHLAFFGGGGGGGWNTRGLAPFSSRRCGFTTTNNGKLGTSSCWDFPVATMPVSTRSTRTALMDAMGDNPRPSEEEARRGSTAGSGGSAGRVSAAPGQEQQQQPKDETSKRRRRPATTVPMPMPDLSSFAYTATDAEEEAAETTAPPKKAEPDGVNAQSPAANEGRTLPRRKRTAVMVEAERSESTVSSSPPPTPKKLMARKVTPSSDSSSGGGEDEGTTTTKPKRTPRGGKKRQRIGPGSLPPPPNYRRIYALVEELRSDRTAPVDSDGASALPQTTRGDVVYRYQILVALMLSSQTKDAVVGDTMRGLQQHGLDVENIRNTPHDVLNRLIQKVGFHNNKTKYLKQVADIIARDYNGDIPPTAEQLMTLPGVGPKMAYIAESIAFGRHSGIGVDTHMHRMFNALGWVNSANPEGTREQLEGWLPRERWGAVNVLWVGFGQEVQQQKEKVLRKAVGCSRPAEALGLLGRVGLDYKKEAARFGLEEDIRLALLKGRV